MACEFLFERLDAFLGGTLPPSECDALRSHLDACVECAALADSFREEAKDDQLFLSSILRRTSGAACGAARDRLCGYVDAELDSIDDGLVRGHLDGCTECAALAAVLVRMRADLPLLSKADPGPGFVEAVLARTTRRRAPEPLADRIVHWLRPLLARPRIAWEGAFIATVVLLLPMIAPGSPLSVVPRRALVLAQSAVPAQRLAAGRVRGMIGDLEAKLDTAELQERAWSTMQRTLGTFVDHAASEQAGSGPDESRQDPMDAQETKR